MTQVLIMSRPRQSKQNYRQKFSMSLNIVIDADLSLSAGDLIFCKFLKLLKEVSQEVDSGIYMIAVVSL